MSFAQKTDMKKTEINKQHVQEPRLSCESAMTNNIVIGDRPLLGSPPQRKEVQL